MSVLGFFAAMLLVLMVLLALLLLVLFTGLPGYKSWIQPSCSQECFSLPQLRMSMLQVAEKALQCENRNEQSSDCDHSNPHIAPSHRS